MPILTCPCIQNYLKLLNPLSTLTYVLLVDTCVWGSVTCQKELIMDYTKYISSFSCPVCLTGVISEDNGVSISIVPLSVGFTFVSSMFPQHGYVCVKVYYSLHLTGTIINEEDRIGDTKKVHADFSGPTMQKY